MTTTQVTAAQRTTLVRPILEDAVKKLLLSIDCKNVYSEVIPPITTWQDFENFLAYHEGYDQSKLEAWFVKLTGFNHSPNILNSMSQYQQIHAVQIVGMAWHNTFHNSYMYVHDQTEKLAWVIEKNKGLVSTEILEASNLQAGFDFGPFGEVSLYQSDVRFDALVHISESNGRVSS